MKNSIVEREQSWLAFLERWPLEKLHNMTLAEYSSPANQDSFCYWLEKRTEDIGSIWGGSAFKFGVYARKDRSYQKSDLGRRFGSEYGWLEKYGESAESAFKKVLNEIVKIAQAAHNNVLSEIDNADLGDAVSWKIAFLYQKRSVPCVLAIFKPDYLRLLLGTNSRVVSHLHQELIQRIQGPLDCHALLDYGDRLWDEIQSKTRTELQREETIEYFLQSSHFEPIKKPTKKLAGFVGSSGGQLAVSLENANVTLYLRDGEWLKAFAGRVQQIVRYKAHSPRSSNLAANAPQLDIGNPIVKVVVPTKAVLMDLCDAYNDDTQSEPYPLVEEESMPTVTSPDVALNQIFFGPPGTGKTYTTLNEALRILDPDCLAAHPYAADEDRTALKKRFDELVKEGRIRFVTFHQSFSYEDFVEGLRAESDDDTQQLRYEVVDGIFKSLCDVASAKVTIQAEAPLSLVGRQVWKMSLGNTLGSDAGVYDECVQGGYALLGYGGALDFSGCKTRGDVQQRFIDAGVAINTPNDYNVTSVTTFVTRMKVGDLIVVSDGNFKFRAIGEITGDYIFNPHEEYVDAYAQMRAVKWLRQYTPSLPHAELMNNQFSQMTLYELRKPALDLDKLTALLGHSAPVNNSSSADSVALTNDSRVLIIDEINRGNISRIFGELITLIEPSKRAGEKEALSVVLPYSKKTFSVPNNIYLIGTMNTADRSLSGLDIALRRRFTFKEMPPRPDLLRNVSVGDLNMGELLSVLNQRIEILLDRDHCLGHAYFMPLSKGGELPLLANIFRQQILPLLQEYFFEDWQRIQWVLNDHRKKYELRFIRQPESDLDLLFGEDVAVNEQSRRWEINEAAFEQPAAYMGILSSEGAERE